MTLMTQSHSRGGYKLLKHDTTKARPSVLGTLLLAPRPQEGWGEGSNVTRTGKLSEATHCT